MACFYPMQALRLASVNKSGKRTIKFVSNSSAQKLLGNPDLISGLPCGQCVGCRLERSRQWAVRCVHEASLYRDNCFITLTFNDECLFQRENPMSLDKRDFQLFMKRLRKRFGDGVRYYHCGEYGELYKRPHYHAIIFNLDFSDKKLWRVVNGNRLYTSDVLTELWPFGFSSIGDVTFDSCAYVARYIMKKHLGKDAWKNYFEFLDESTGELVGQRVPEYTTMSRRSGIGKEWLNKYLADIYTSDRVFLRGRGFSKPPKYYDSQFEIIDPVRLSAIKEARISSSLERAHDNTEQRLIAKQKVKLAQISSLKRNLE